MNILISKTALNLQENSCSNWQPEIQGFTVWQLNDCYSYHRRGASLRVKAFAQNLAGAFDIYRRRKLGGHPGAYFPEVAPKD